MGTSNTADHNAAGAQLCRQVQEKHSVEGVGNFTAFQDGGIHVAFDDRALLYMQPQSTRCDVITPEGQRVSVAVQNPLGVQQYVCQAADFAAWAFSSPVQRGEVLQKAAEVQKELDKCQRSALLCDWAQGRTLIPCVEGSSLSKQGSEQLSGEQTLFDSHVREAFGETHTGFEPAEREQLIQAFLTNSKRLLSTL